MRKRSLLGLTALLLLPMAGFAQSSMLRGKVRRSDGVVVNNATVELRGSNGAVIGQAFTRNDGDFSFSRLVPGEYEVHVTMSGYESAMQIVELELENYLKAEPNAKDAARIKEAIAKLRDKKK